MQIQGCEWNWNEMFQTMAVVRGCQGWKILPEGWVGAAWDHPVPQEQGLLSMGSSKPRGPSVMDELLRVQQVSLQQGLPGAGQAWPLSLHRNGDRAMVAAGQPWVRDQSHGLRLPRGAAESPAHRSWTP